MRRGRIGSWVLLQPERIYACAQTVIRTLQADEHQRGCLMEERVLQGDLAYESSMTSLACIWGASLPEGSPPATKLRAETAPGSASRGGTRRRAWPSVRMVSPASRRAGSSRTGGPRSGRTPARSPRKRRVTATRRPAPVRRPCCRNAARNGGNAGPCGRCGAT